MWACHSTALTFEFICTICKILYVTRRNFTYCDVCVTFAIGFKTLWMKKHWKLIRKKNTCVLCLTLYLHYK